MPEIDIAFFSKSYKEMLRKTLNIDGTKSGQKETIMCRVVGNMTPLTDTIPDEPEERNYSVFKMQQPFLRSESTPSVDVRCHFQ